MVGFAMCVLLIAYIANGAMYAPPSGTLSRYQAKRVEEWK